MLVMVCVTWDISLLSLSQYLRDCSYPTKVLGPSFIIFLPYFYINISCLSFNIIDFYHFFFLFQYQQYFVFFVCTQQWQCFLWCYHFKKIFLQSMLAWCDCQNKNDCDKTKQGPILQYRKHADGICFFWWQISLLVCSGFAGRWFVNLLILHRI